MLQIIAMLSMLIDHIGVIHENFYAARAVGRFAMPIYAYFISCGFCFTRDRYKYFKRLAFVAVLSQYGYLRLLAFSNSTNRLNICYEWLFALLALSMVKIIQKNVILKYLCIIICFVCCMVLNTDYFGLAFLWVFFFNSFRNDYTNNRSFIICSIICFYSLCFGKIQLLSLLSIPLIMFFQLYKIKERLPNKYSYIWRLFYPVHLTLLGVLK